MSTVGKDWRCGDLWWRHGRASWTSRTQESELVSMMHAEVRVYVYERSGVRIPFAVSMSNVCMWCVKSVRGTVEHQDRSAENQDDSMTRWRLMRFESVLGPDFDSVDSHDASTARITASWTPTCTAYFDQKSYVTAL